MVKKAYALHYEGDKEPVGVGIYTFYMIGEIYLMTANASQSSQCRMNLLQAITLRNNLNNAINEGLKEINCLNDNQMTTK
jgi:hypothetical protein